MPIRTLIITAALAVLAFSGCSRKDEAPAEKPAPVAGAAVQQAPVIPTLTATTGTTGVDAGGVASGTDGNRPPKVIAVPFKEPHVRRGGDVEVIPEGLDPDGDLVTFRFEWFINGEKMTDIDAPVLPGDRFRKGDQIALRVVPSDGKDEGEPFTSLPFAVPNAPPHFVSSPPLQFQAQTYAYEARAQDPDGDALTYILELGPAGMAIDGATGKVTWQIGQEHAGGHTVRIVAQDEEGLKAVQEYTLAIKIEKQEAN